MRHRSLTSSGMRPTKSLAYGLLALWLVLPGTTHALEKYDLTVDFAGEAREQPRFWQSTGMSPSDMLLARDMQLTLKMIGDTHGPAIRYLRPHYLLDLVEIEFTDDGQQVIDWSRLDQALDPVHRNGILMIFELMGNPSGAFDDFREEKQVWAWRHFIESLAIHLMERYGRETVEQWYFETTNEPDIHPFWPQTHSGFLNYYDASSEGLKAANPKLRFGGPGAGRFMSPTLKALLEHCDYGTNFLTGEQGVRLDFISFHVKSKPHEMVRYEEHVVDYIRSFHPRFKDVPLMNNEADPIGGWGIPRWWRPGPWPAAFVMQSIDLHNQIILDKLGADLKIAAGDNAFLGDWGKRTLHARFLPGDNDAPQWGSSDEGGWKPWDRVHDDRPLTEDFYLIKKPAFTAMSLAALMGDARFPVTGFPPLTQRVDTYVSEAPHLGCIATRRPDGAIVLICYNAPAINLSVGKDGDPTEPATPQLQKFEQSAADLSISLRGLEFSEARVMSMRIDEVHGNPVAAWREMGSPADLSAEQFNLLQRAQEPGLLLLEPVEIEDERFNIHLTMDAPSMEAIILTPINRRIPPPEIEDLKASSYSGPGGVPVSYLSWDVHQSNSLMLFEVHYAGPGEEKFRKVSAEGILDRHFSMAGTEPGGKFRVVAKNLFGDQGQPAELSVD